MSFSSRADAALALSLLSFRACRVGVVLAVVLVAPGVAAQTEHTFQSWSAGFLQMRTGESGGASPGLWLDTHVRRGETSTAVLVRPGVGYYFNPQLSVWAGYLFAPTLIDGAADRTEHRPWQQFQGVFRWGESILTLRSRFEQRFMDDAEDIGFRGRQLARLQLNGPEDWAFVLWDEAFVGFNETDFGQPTGLDQNRVFIGPAWLPRESVRIEPGYLSVWLPRSGGSTWVHALSVNAFLTF